MILLSADSSYDKALKKADDPLMVLDGNPLRETKSTHQCLVCKNMERLHNDARAWSDQRHGEAYRAIRGMVIKGE